jgi:hypothetical protein
VSDISPSRASIGRVMPSHSGAITSEAEARMFQASSAFVSACQEATVAMHALTAKIREMEKKVEPVRRVKAKAG